MKGFGTPKKSTKKKVPKTNLDVASSKLISKAFKFHSEGNISQAAKCYQLFIDQGLKDIRVLNNYGAICQYRGEVDKAIVLYKKSIELDSNNPFAYSNMAGIFKDQGDLKEAENLLRKAIKIKPNLAGPYSNLGTIVQELGRLEESEVLLRKAIELKPDFANAYSNLGTIVKELGRLKEAEILQRRAIELKPDFANAYSNLGAVLKSLGRLKEAELSILKAIKLDNDHARSYFLLSDLTSSSSQNDWECNLFFDDILKNKNITQRIDIYFARANIHHKKKEFIKSAESLIKANSLKLDIHPSNFNALLEKSKKLFAYSNKHKIINKEESHDHIFIVGMPRSGSTLLESIISMNKDVCDLGEVNIFEDSFLEWERLKDSHKDLTLNKLYSKKINDLKSKATITTNKWLYNYRYAGIIASQLANAKIIHCNRNPLDNILSIYRTNFAKGHTYSSSLIDCAKVYLDQDKLMQEYKKQYQTKIYDLNYDSLVLNPLKEIKSLIQWLGWEWDDSYLCPNLNPRPVLTASSIQVRSPINARSVGGWRNYREMLQPAIDVITNTEKHRHLIS